MKKILIPTDFSDLAQFALDLALEIAEREESELILLNVVEYPTTPTFNVMGMNSINNIDNIYIIEILDRIKDQLEKTTKEIKASGIKISSEVKLGNAFRSIADEISTKEVDLVIMGTKGSGGVEGLLIGSNTEKVVRLSGCPVLTLKNKVSLHSLKEIVFPSDLSLDQGKLVEEVKAFQKMLKARLHVVKINTPVHFETDRAIRKNLKEFSERFKLENFTLNVYNHTQEEEGIVYFADDINADIIALGTHGRTGLLHLLSGSIAEDVVNHAKRPVWTYSLKR